VTKHARTSRLAPSPTGALHLGNVRTFLVNWALARRGGWILKMRIEDLDGPRVKPGATEHTLEVLDWLGIDFDGPVLIQSRNLEPYREAMRRLCAAGVVYPCQLSRREIELAASAPHAGDDAAAPAARPATLGHAAFQREDTNYRMVVPPDPVTVHDEFAGVTRQDPAADGGDFVVWTRRGTPAYQLAVVVDDAAQGVTDVVRGDDLLPSAARQMLLDAALGLPVPRWWHLPLVVGPDGRRLAKRHGDTRVDRYRQAGVPPQRVIGLVAHWCGLTPRPAPMDRDEFRDGLDIAAVSRHPVTFTDLEDRWLLSA
jgi:glutamyl-tRNA synthetase